MYFIVCIGCSFICFVWLGCVVFSLVFSCLKYFVCFYVIFVAVTFGSLYRDDIPHQELLGEINALRGGVRSSSVIMVFLLLFVFVFVELVLKSAEPLQPHGILTNDFNDFENRFSSLHNNDIVMKM